MAFTPLTTHERFTRMFEQKFSINVSDTAALNAEGKRC